MTETALAEAILYMALELSNRTWKVGFQAAGRRRFMSVRARDVEGLSSAITEAQRRLKVTPDCRVVSCYEAGRDGFWLHRALVSKGVENVIVDPASIKVDRRARRKKTDNIDVKKLLGSLLRHVGGEDDVWSVLRVPSEEVEDARRDSRERDRLVKERTGHSNRMRALLITQGIDLTVTKKFAAQLESARLWDGSALLSRLEAELQREFARWLQVQEQIAGIEKRWRLAVKENRDPEDPRAHNVTLTKINRLLNLKGIGETSA